MDEAAGLTASIGLVVVYRAILPLRVRRPSMLLGEGEVQAQGEAIAEHDVAVVVVDAAGVVIERVEGLDHCCDEHDESDDDEDVGVDEGAASADMQAAAFAAEDCKQAGGDGYSSAKDVEQDVCNVRGGVAVEHTDHDACVLPEQGKDF